VHDLKDCLPAMPVIDYLAFAARNRRFLALGCLLTFTSSAGQTYLIGMFGPEIRAGFALSHTDWGALYLMGTLASAVLLPWTGQLIDRVDLRLYVGAVLAGLALACLTMSLVQSAAMLALAIFLLRQMGQGLTSHAAATSMARYHGPDRGKALAISSTGMAAGEAVLPVLMVLLIAAVGWRQTYGLMGLAIALVLLPLAMWLLRGHGRRHARHLVGIARAARDRSGANPATVMDQTRLGMLQELRFYLLLPAFISPSFIITALFFHHLTLAAEKGWSATWLAGQYWVFALSSVIAALAVGPLIDRLSASRVMPLFLLPLALALLLLTPADAALWLLPYLALLGLSAGLSFTGFTALWAELYGARHLGAIRSLTSAIGVFASALGPVTAGLLLDLGMTMAEIALGFTAFCLAATLTFVTALRLPGRQRPQGQESAG
jgi:MFS family permease